MTGTLPKGITTHRQRPGKFTAQYWDSNTKHMKCIGSFYTVDEAVAARNNFILDLIKYNGKVLPKVNSLPKGIKRLANSKKSDTYTAEIQFWYGRYKDKHITIHIGTYETIEDAVNARIQFLDNLK